jgi:hypothetical protein
MVANPILPAEGKRNVLVTSALPYVYVEALAEEDDAHWEEGRPGRRRQKADGAR